MGNKTNRSAIISNVSIRKWWIGFAVVLLLSLALEWLMEAHPHFGFDGYFGFYAVFGFISCVAIVVFSKFLGKFLKRPEQYYEEDE